jgi:hypothetical protein
MNNGQRDIWRGQPRLRVLFMVILATMILKIIARYAWGYRIPNWLDLGIAIALVVVLLTAIRRSKRARIG